MAYKYFTKQLVAKADEVNLATIFADKQELAKNRLNTNYSLPEIVDWIKENTNNFKRSENYFIDLDEAIKRLVFKYYTVTGAVNPFTEQEIEDVEAKSQPRVPTEVSTSGVKTGTPDVSAVVSAVAEVAPTKQDYITVIEGLELQAEMDAENPIYQEIIDGLKLQLELMD